MLSFSHVSLDPVSPCYTTFAIYAILECDTVPLISQLGITPIASCTVIVAQVQQAESTHYPLSLESSQRLNGRENDMREMLDKKSQWHWHIIVPPSMSL